MEYNTQRTKLMFSEYGRNVKKLIDYAITIEDREKRTAFAKIIVGVMGQVNPQAKEIGDYKHKLWDHLFILSGFQLDVDCPYPIVRRDQIELKPESLHYKNNHIKYRHYGKNMERIIEKVIEYPKGDEQDRLIELIANHLKKSYLNWNRDSVNDELIYEQFTEMTHGKLKLSKDFQLRNTRDILKSRKKPGNNPSNSGSASNGKSKQNYNKNRKGQ